jgi:HAD superfamily hydrolase (TIGR01490 family)
VIHLSDVPVSERTQQPTEPDVPGDVPEPTAPMELGRSAYGSMVGSGPSAAFFDLDRTLMAGSSAFIMGRMARSAGLVPTSQFVRDAASAVAFKLKGSNDKTTDGVRDRILGAVRGMRQDDLVALNAEVLPRLLAKIRPEARRLLDLHRHAGRNTYIVSAAPVEIVESLARSLGMTAGIGTRGEVVDGVYTGGLVGPFCYGPGNVTSMQDIARWDGLDLSQCYAYSDSSSDLPMLQAVGHPVAVNPDDRLARHARAYGWPIVHFSQRTKSVIRRSVAAAGATAIAGASFAAGTVYGRRT